MASVFARPSWTVGNYLIRLFVCAVLPCALAVGLWTLAEVWDSAPASIQIGDQAHGANFDEVETYQAGVSALDRGDIITAKLHLSPIATGNSPMAPLARLLLTNIAVTQAKSMPPAECAERIWQAVGAFRELQECETLALLAANSLRHNVEVAKYQLHWQELEPQPIPISTLSNSKTAEATKSGTRPGENVAPMEEKGQPSTAGEKETAVDRGEVTNPRAGFPLKKVAPMDKTAAQKFLEHAQRRIRAEYTAYQQTLQRVRPRVRADY